MRFQELSPAINNLLEIYKSFTNISDDDLILKFHGKPYTYLKKEVTQVTIEVLKPIQEKFVKLGGKLNN